MLKRLLALLILVMSLPVQANPVTVISPVIPGLHQTDYQGVFDIVINKLLVESGLATHTVLPTKRSYFEFDKCISCCFSPDNLDPLFQKASSQLIETLPINIAKIYIFTRKGDPTLSHLSQLTGKRVGIKHGTTYGTQIDEAPLNRIGAHSILQNMKMLDQGRVDAVIAYIPDMYKVFQEIDADLFDFQEANPLAIYKDSLVCKSVSHHFIQTFNHALLELEASGELKQMLGLYYLAPIRS